MVFRNAAALIVRRLLMVLVMAMIGVEKVGELSHLVLHVGGLDERLFETGTRKLALDLFDLLAGLVVERVEQLLQPFLLG